MEKHKEKKEHHGKMGHEEKVESKTHEKHKEKESGHKKSHHKAK